MLIRIGENAEKLEEIVGAELYRRQRANRYFCVPVEREGFYLAFDRCDIADFRKAEARKCEDRISVYCGARGLAVSGGGVRVTELLRALPQDGEPFLLLTKFIFSLTEGDLDAIERIEKDISELELGLIATQKPIKSAAARIVELRRTLLRLKWHYEHLQSVLDRLMENENESVPKSAVPRLVSLRRHIGSLAQSVGYLREYVTQVRETYQAQIDIEQNQIMKIFTVITVICMPLTLIAGWYGMNFQIPELQWKFGYLYVFLLSAAVCTLCFLYFKKKKWF